MAYTKAQIEEKKHAILSGLSEGLSQRQATFAAGITEATLFAWRKEDPMFEAAVKAHQAKRPDRAPSRAPIARTSKDVPEVEVPDVIEEICKAIRAGLPLEQSCLLANVHRGTLRQWMIADDEVASRINRAQSQNMLWWISKLRQGAEKDWRAALAYLERVFPYLFAEVKAVEITTRAEDKQASSIIDVTPEATIKRLTEMSDEELQTIIGRGTI